MNTTTVLSKALNKIIDTTDKVIPITRIPSVYCFNRWLHSHVQMNENPVTFVESDYYNGSENDLVNIFVEFLNLSHGDHCYNGNYTLKRIEFLANEGLHVIDLNKIKTKNFKVSPREADEVVKNLSKKGKKPTKKSPTKKPKKKVRRDMNGRFVKNN